LELLFPVPAELCPALFGFFFLFGSATAAINGFEVAEVEGDGDSILV
jgi:hypothetical protein